MQNNTQESWDENEFYLRGFLMGKMESFFFASLRRASLAVVEEISEAVEQERERIKQGILSLNQTQSSRHD